MAAEPFASSDEADGWLASADPESEAERALGVLNAVLRAHRVASADPHVREVARDQLGLRQDADIRFSFLVEPCVVVVAKRSGRRLFRKNHGDEFFLRTGENITDFTGRNIRFKPALLR